ncbi:hypothetical protein V6N11_067803 [Hibiscus sabdariffa]|uniref:Uncharacterized protein n=1 Tax=Hibiscus sabdariffa TaxID=183260 RepID=A0ABR2SRV2_9ROSI
MRIRRLPISVILGRRRLRYFSRRAVVKTHEGSMAFSWLLGVSPVKSDFEIMGRGEAELHDDGFGSPMSDEALIVAVSDEPGIGLPMLEKALTAADLADRCQTKH